MVKVKTLWFIYLCTLTAIGWFPFHFFSLDPPSGVPISTERIRQQLGDSSTTVHLPELWLCGDSSAAWLWTTATDSDRVCCPQTTSTPLTAWSWLGMYIYITSLYSRQHVATKQGQESGTRTCRFFSSTPACFSDSCTLFKDVKVMTTRRSHSGEEETVQSMASWQQCQ